MKKFIVCKKIKGCTDRTIHTYKDYITRILQKINKSVLDITVDDIRLYIATRVGKVSVASIDNERRALCTFFSFLQDEGIVTMNPMRKIEKVKGKKKKKEAFTDMEIEKIRNACETNRERAIIEVLLSTGARVSELVNIKLSEIEDNKVILHGKGQKDRYVYLNAKAIFAMQKYLEEREDDNEYLFAGGIGFGVSKDMLKLKKDFYKHKECLSNGHLGLNSVEHIVRRLKKKAGVQEAYPHKFRRTFATNALKNGMSIEKVSKLLGHESIETTQIYLDINEKDLELAHERYVR